MDIRNDGMAERNARLPHEARRGVPSQAASPAPRPGPQRQRPRTFGALDLGTNNCRLLIARARPDGELTIVDAFSRIVRLGEGLQASGRLSDASIERAIDALRICADKLRRRGVHLSRAVATEACRQASNGEAFVARVREETGIVLDIIAPGEEAKLAVGGCHALLEEGEGPALVFDIGGGSTELARVLDEDGGHRIGHWMSMPWGVVSLAEAEPHDDTDPVARVRAYAGMKRRATEALRDFAGLVPDETRELRLLGTSGTVTTLASVHLGLPAYDRRRVDGCRVPTESMRAICADLAGKCIEDRALVGCIGRERADLVIAGCAILEAILDLWPAPRIGVADRGIREGILRALMASQGE